MSFSSQRESETLNFACEVENKIEELKDVMLKIRLPLQTEVNYAQYLNEIQQKYKDIATNCRKNLLPR